jgi:hypothetical protein
MRVLLNAWEGELAADLYAVGAVSVTGSATSFDTQCELLRSVEALEHWPWVPTIYNRASGVAR